MIFLALFLLLLIIVIGRLVMFLSCFRDGPILVGLTASSTFNLVGVIAGRRMMVDDFVVNAFSCCIAVHQSNVQLTQWIYLHKMALLRLNLAHYFIFFVLVDEFVRHVTVSVV